MWLPSQTSKMFSYSTYRDREILDPAGDFQHFQFNSPFFSNWPASSFWFMFGALHFLRSKTHLGRFPMSMSELNFLSFSFHDFHLHMIGFYWRLPLTMRNKKIKNFHVIIFLRTLLGPWNDVKLFLASSAATERKQKKILWK